MVRYSLAFRTIRSAVIVSFALNCCLLFRSTSPTDRRPEEGFGGGSRDHRSLRFEVTFPSIDGRYNAVGENSISAYPSERNPIPLAELVNTDPLDICTYDKNGSRSGHNFTLIQSAILDDKSVTHPSTRRIPRIVHMTSKSRCMHDNFVENIRRWQFANHSFCFHNEAAMDRLLQKYWAEFPQLQLMQSCILSGAAKADLWRLLVLWEYGGIYTDIDNAPGPLFKNGTAINDEDDSFFVMERIGTLSQYFMASSPKHPLMHIAVLETLKRIQEVSSVGLQDVAWVSGPEAMRQSMKIFMRSQGTDEHQRLVKGRYIGVGNRSVTIQGKPRTTNNWIHRESLHPLLKKQAYQAMEMKHFSWIHRKGPGEKWNISCHEHVYNQYALKHDVTVDST